ncbi:MAG: glycosyltransferase family 4 protein [Pseudonocardia sp.]
MSAAATTGTLVLDTRNPARTGTATPSVLHVSQPVDGGVARYVVEAATDQINRGWTVTVACPDSGWLAGELHRRGISHVTWNARRSPGPSVAAETARLRRIVDDVTPDLVHLHSAKAGLAGRLALRGALPTLFQPHGWSWLAATGTLATLSRGWERLGARWADRVVCVGDGEAAQAGTVAVGRLAVVRNGVDVRRFRAADLAAQRAARAELGLSATAPLVVCPARWARQKGQDVLLAAWTAVRAQCPDAQLALVGGDAPADVELPAGVRLVDDVTDIRPWLAAADVVALPSRWEGLSLALLEAMATGRSTVVSDIPGLAEIVDAHVGAVVPVEQADALAAALVARLTDPSLAMAEGAAAAAKATAELDSRMTFDRLAELTAAVAAERAPVAA